MAIKVIMPQLGLTMTQGTVTKWLKKEGDWVEKGEPLLEVMTDKANMEVESPGTGILLKILAAEGTKVPITQVIAFLGEPGEKIDEALASAASGAPAEADVPQEASVTSDPQRRDGAKVFISPRARQAARRLNVDYTVIKGTGPDGRIVERDVIAFADSGVTKAGSPVKMTPVARKMAESYGIDAGEIAGLKEGQRITKADVLALQKSKEAAATPQAPDPGLKIIPLAGMRKIIAERMSYNVHTAAQVTLTTEVDMTETVRMREHLLPDIERAGGFRLSYTDILVKVVARALREYPHLNATLREDCIELISDINIGVAAAVKDGLVVPVVHRADTLSITEIGAKVKDLVIRARQGKLTPDDMHGGTFTISNLGMYDIDAFTPIINLPEAAILGVGRLVQKPVVFRGEIVPRWMMFLSLTFDHRLVDGAPSAEFLRRIKHFLENPYALLS